MKTYIKTFILSVLLISFVNINTASSQFRFGVRGGLDVVNNRINDKILDSGNRLGFQIGGVIEITSPVIGLGGELAVLYGYQEYNIKNKDVEISNYHYINIPLNVKQRIKLLPNFGIFVAAGPYVSFKVGGDEVDTMQEQFETKKFGAGVNAGAGISVLNNIELGMYYRKMLTNNYSDDKPGISDIWKKNPDNWTINLTYFF